MPKLDRLLKTRATTRLAPEARPPRARLQADGQVGARVLRAPFMPVIYKRRPNTEIDHVRRQLLADYWADDLVSGAVQLLHLQKVVRRDLPRIRSKMLVVVGSKDATVPLWVAPYIERRALGVASFETRILEGAMHCFPLGMYSSEASLVVKEWMARP